MFSLIQLKENGEDLPYKWYFGDFQKTINIFKGLNSSKEHTQDCKADLYWRRCGYAACSTSVRQVTNWVSSFQIYGPRGNPSSHTECCYFIS